MIPRRTALLTILTPTIIATVVVLLVSRVYTAPVVFSITYGYFAAGNFSPAFAGFRTPIYGWLMKLGFALQMPTLPVIIQCLLWILCIATASAMTWALTRSARSTLAVGVLLVFGEVVIMHELPANWFLLTDSLYANLLSLGLLCTILGAVIGKRFPRLAGAALLGIVNVIRPLFAGPMIGTFAAVTMAIATKRKIIGREMGVIFLLLWVPTVILSIGNRMAWGSFNTSSQMGAFLMLTTIRTVEPDDIIFDDPELNHAFHATIRTGRAPTAHAGTDPFFMVTERTWHALSSFYGSVVGEADPPRMRFAVSALSTRIALRIIAAHPLSYLRHAGRQALFLLVPDNAMRSYWWMPDPSMMIPMQQSRWQDLFGLAPGLYHGMTPMLEMADPRIARLLDTTNIGIRLPKTAGPFSSSVAVLLGCLCLLESVRLIVGTRNRLLGFTILILLMNTVLHGTLQASVMLVSDARYRIPGLLTGMTALLLTLTSLLHSASLPTNLGKCIRWISGIVRHLRNELGTPPSKQAIRLGVLFVSLTAVLLATMYARVFVVPVLTNDTNAYMATARFVHSALGTRPPFYGWLPIITFGMGKPMLLVWFQVLWWVACFGAGTYLAILLTRSLKIGMICGVVALFIDWVVMYSLPLQWRALPDALYVDWSTLGILLMLCGFATKQRRLFLVGTIFIGLGNLARPMMITVIVGAGLLVYAAWRRCPAMKRGMLSGAVLALCAPTLMISLTNRVTSHSFRLTPLPGLNANGFVLQLLQPEDIIYDDPTTNAQFHETVAMRQLPKSLTGWNVMEVQENFPSPEAPWKPLMMFYSTRVAHEDAAVMRFVVDDEARKVLRRVIFLHPLEYGALVAHRIVEISVPTRTLRTHYYDIEDPFRVYAQSDVVWGNDEGRQRLFGASRINPYRTDLRMAKWLNAENYGLRLPEKAGPKTLMILAACIALALTESVRRMRSQDHSDRTLGMAILVCGGTSVLNATLYAGVTTFVEPRYTVSGLILGELCIALTLASVLMRLRRQQSPSAILGVP